MESPAIYPAGGCEHFAAGGISELVDPFILEALGNPRHRLTVLRMELAIQQFMQNPDHYQFEFLHFPTSYLRCAAHRVAQYYGLQTITLDNGGDGSGSRILVRKSPASRYPPLRLSDIPTKPDIEKIEQVKIAIRQRPKRALLTDANNQEVRKSPSRTVEEREEEYEKARARIFNDYSSPDSGDLSLQAVTDVNKLCLSGDEECSLIPAEDANALAAKDGANSIAIFRDREKDLNDPDYCRSYGRYAKCAMPSQGFSVEASSALMTPFFPYGGGFLQVPSLPMAQTPLGYGTSNTSNNPFGSFVHEKPPADAVYFQWPNPTMAYAHSCEPFQQAAFQVPFLQRPLSFEHLQYG